MKYYLELTDDEVKNLAGILGSFIGKNERNKDIKELVESARNIFEKVIHTEESCPDCFCEDCTKDCEMKNIIKTANEGLDFDKIAEEVEQDVKEQSEEVTIASVLYEKQKYRPFNDCNELFEHYQKKYELTVGYYVNFPSLYKPCIWVKPKFFDTCQLMITGYSVDDEGKHCVWLTDSWITLEKLFDDYVFLDDSPIGVEV